MKEISKQDMRDLKPAVIGIAWRSRSQTRSFEWFCRAVEEAGAQFVLLDQILTPHLRYDENKKLLEGKADTNALTDAAGRMIRESGWKGSNAEKALGDVRGVLFLGGEDISPSLYKHQEAWHGNEKDKDYCGERDISDYLLMSYLLDQDIPFLGSCRGMQMLSVVSGARMTQDILAFFQSLSEEYGYQHRPKVWGPGMHNDFLPNDVQVKEGTLLHEITGRETIRGCPCWHHQAARDVSGTNLIVSGYARSGNVSIIEAVERVDKTFALGVQFHPEVPIGKAYDQAANRGDYMDHDTALAFFKRLVEESKKRAAR
ncbi:MAG: gamma-glutamyl-gamma-aminobutyrate hydrolase family protein [Eubacterium sp.]|nr:gamma-glutamyl-gamma-aminobutyrate hydrolase family protein [Eubacterium sp.]